jgi:hypothetical protein
MRTFCQILRVAAAAALGFAASCGGGSDTLPADWTGASALTIEQSQCKGSADGAMVTSTLDVTDKGGTLAVTVKDVSFRCQQSLCAYATDSGATTRVLVQPCDLHPTNVVRCDCLYDVTFTLPARADRTAVEVYKRFDFYGATTPPTPTLAVTAPVGAAQTYCSARGPLTAAEAVDAGDLIPCPANGSCVPFAGGGQAELPDGAPVPSQSGWACVIETGCAVLRVTDAKTAAGERALKLPTVLQPLLAKLAEGKRPDDRLFRSRNRHWVRRSVEKCCAAAGVRVVSAHGLRGTHAMIAREVGVSGVLLAQAMGHESETTTTNHYAGHAAVANASISRVAGLVH